LKKEAKTFARLSRTSRRQPCTGFLVLFCKKEPLHLTDTGNRNVAKNSSACRAQSTVNAVTNVPDADMLQASTAALSVVQVGPPRRWTMFIAVVAMGKSYRATAA
jgi:hypothetical protein